jgi:hypothetical protein
MSSHQHSAPVAPLDLSKWRNVPWILIGVGGIGAAIGYFTSSPQQFGFSWLVAFMFFLSLCLGALFLVIVHHLFDAAWSVPIRRFIEHIACLSFPTMLFLFLPIALLATKIYPWMGPELQTHPDHALHSKAPLFTIPSFYLVAAICFAVWGILSYRFRHWSLKQDQTGSVECTRKMRFLAGFGVFFFAITLTLAAIMWMKALEHEWFSTMFGVWYFAASAWTTIATVYVLTVILQRTGHLRDVIKEEQYYFIGSLFLAFTVFYAYISFSQYFIIWNANIPEETFHYITREKGMWWDVSMIIIFGHFFLPFLMLLRIDWKLKLAVMLPLCAWAWLMHFCDMQFQIMPKLHPQGATAGSIALDFACMLFMGGILAKVFLHSVNNHPFYPQRDPRMAEALGVYVPPTTSISTAPERAK